MALDTLAEFKISPLCCAVLYERHEMIESLIQAGADVDEVGCIWGLAPLHVAVIADSVQAFKCLEGHGANLELRDVRGQSIIDLIKSTLNGSKDEESLYHYLVTNYNSYLRYSWCAALKRLW
jgi:hypothetical protein